MIMIQVPNIMWARRKPDGYDPTGENKMLLFVERIGQILCTTAILIFNDTVPRKWEPWLAWFISSALLMLLYEGFWIRFFRGGRTLRDFYRPFLGIPAPGATLPVTAFLLLGVYGRLIWLVAASIILSVGHIGIHMHHIRKMGQELIQAMQELVDYSEGKIDLRTTRLNVTPVCETISATDIKETRKKLRMTQGVFAIVIGVSKKTVESWETGRYIPDGAARRLISMINHDPSFLERYGIIQSDVK